MNIKDHYRQNPDCLVEDMNGELLLFNPASATTLHLNGSSALVWQLSTGEHSLEDIIEGLQQSYPQQAQQVEVDVLSVMVDFLDKAVLEKVECEA